ncbi:MAG: hypothetical protein M1830_006271 [Pleopsidium flavum]|nr:MAG: hypothetical protein M1830_006271 [Pleopsidium flavum]
MVSITSPVLRPVGPMLAPEAKPLLRRPTLIRKRDNTDMDLDEDAVPPSPSKRSKVTFDTDVEVRIMDEWEKGPELIRAEVRRAVEKHAHGENTGYDRVKEVFTTEPMAVDAASPTTMRNYLLALLGNVASLNKSCSGLVHAVLESQWLGRDESYVALYVRFLGTLVSAQGGFIGAVLRMLINDFCNGIVSKNLSVMASAEHFIVPLASGQLPNYPVVPRTQLYARAHMALKYLLQLIPSASGAVSSILAAAFPHSTDSKKAHVAYVHNLLKLIEYAPELRPDILRLITERLVKIDVQIQVDMEDLEEDVGEGLIEDVAKIETPLEDLEDSEDEDDENDSVNSDEILDEEAQRMKDVKSNVEKMDFIIDILFAYYGPFFSRNTEEKENALELLLSHFTTIILPTYRSRHTQFLLFHFAQTSPSLIDSFAGTCVHIAFDKSRPAIIRQSAAAYLASFVARGKHVPSQVVQDVFDIIGSQLHGLLTEYEGTCRGPDLRRYATFYALVQALLYIFCFRWQDLMVDPDNYVEEDDIAAFDEKQPVWAPGVKETLFRTIYSPLNPLKVCSPAIVAEFARIDNDCGLIYVFSLLETNKRLRLSRFTGSASRGSAYNQPDRETALSAKNDESYYQLDAYFPFDPYHLPRSKKWIEGDYVEWKGMPEADEQKDEVDSLSDSDEEELSELEDEGTGTEESD